MPLSLSSVILVVTQMRFRLASNARARVWTRIGALSRAGVPISTALDFLHQSNIRGTAAKEFIQHQRVAMRSSGFAAGAKGWVPAEELTIIEITQEGRIAEGFEQAARIAEIRYKLRTTLVSGLAYPTTLLLVSSTIIAFLPDFAFNVMVQVVDVKEWSTVSRSILSFSEFLSDWGVPLALLIVTLVGLSIWAAPRWNGDWRNRFEWFPSFAIYRQFTGPEVLSAWLALMQAGIQRIRALSQLEKSLPGYLAAHVRVMRSHLYRGEPIETALDTGLFSAETLDDLRVYERIGDFTLYAHDIARDDINRAQYRVHTK